MAATKKATIVEAREGEHEYDFKGTEVIIDHPKYGRLFLTTGFGGMGEMRGGAVRWEHGMAIQLRADDTFAVLDKDDTLYNAMHGYGEDRAILEWPGKIIESVANSAGLHTVRLKKIGG